MAASHWPSMMCRSVRQTPAPPIFTMTSSGPLIVGSGTSSMTGWVWNLCKRTAFMGPPRPASRFICVHGSGESRLQSLARALLAPGGVDPPEPPRVGFSLSSGGVVPVPQHAAADAGVRLDAHPGEPGLAQVQRYVVGRDGRAGHR